MMIKLYSNYLLLIIFVLLTACQTKPDKIDRNALVSRHNPTITAIDSLDVLSVGNGSFAFTTDATGLQTFPEYYEKGIPLGTFSNWAWHSFPNVENYQLEQVSQKFATCADSVPYVFRYFEGEKRGPSEFLRQNPHRLHMGLVGYRLLKKDGSEVELDDIQDIHYTLDMWQGKLESTFTVENIPVKTIMYAHQQQDQIAVSVESPLIQEGRLGVRFRFPYGAGCHRCAGYDFSRPDAHTTDLLPVNAQEVLFERKLDTTHFWVRVHWEQMAEMQKVDEHHYLLQPAQENSVFRFSFSYSQNQNGSNPGFTATEENNALAWEQFWESGGAVDFSGSTDPRAHELERRVVLSQYLTRIQSTGKQPPQETGLTYNSWYGNFHLEMHWWHGVHFMLWNRPELFENSMDWYNQIMPEARAMAQWQGYQGVRWPKQVAPDGVESPSNTGTFLVWQQPHPIYYAHLFYRHDPSRATLERFKDVVFATADFMASLVHYNEATSQYDLCPPLIPAQEIFDRENTYNPSFELAYWHYGLSMAQQWRQNLGMEPDTLWQKVMNQLAPLPVKDSLYLPHQNRPDAYEEYQYRADHPIVLGALGFLPASAHVDPQIMTRTFDEVWKEWNWGHTWGWDYPLIAMSAARLGKTAQAVDALFMDVQKNTYLKNGHNYQNEGLSIYLPGNGGLLTAVAMMAAGWEGAPDKDNPGFPDNGQWQIRHEGLVKMP